MNSKRGAYIGITVTALVLITAVLFRELQALLPPFLYALVLAYLLLPLQRGLLRRGIDENASLLLLFGLLLLVLLICVLKIVPVLSTQLLEMLQLLPNVLQQVDKCRLALPEYWAVSLPPVIEEQLSAMLGNSLTAFAEGAEQLVLRLLGSWHSLLGVLLTPMLAYYLLRDRRQIMNALLQILPPEQHDICKRLAAEVDYLLRQYIYGYLLVAALVGVMTAAVLMLLGIRYAPALGLIMGICDLVPYLGPFIGAVPALAVAAGQGSRVLIFTAMALFLVQQAESLVITPLIMDKRIGLHPVATIFAVLAGAKLFGLAGSVLAVPFCLVASLLLRYAYNEFVACSIDKFADNDGKIR